jgi:transcriptional regulator with XRE-family HTH domain
MELGPTIKNTLKTLRLKHGFKQKEVATLLGMRSEDRISHWEKGIAIPGLINLFKLSMLYNVSPYELYPEISEEVKNSLLRVHI